MVPIDHATGQHMDGLAGDVTAPTPAPATDERVSAPEDDANHARIWLEPSDGYDPSEGRQWCQDDVWTGNTDYDDCGLPTEYVRADIAVAAREAGRRERDAEVAGYLAALSEIAQQRLSVEMDADEHHHADYEGAYVAIVGIARAALAAAPGPGGEVGNG